MELLLPELAEDLLHLLDIAEDFVIELLILGLAEDLVLVARVEE